MKQYITTNFSQAEETWKSYSDRITSDQFFLCHTLSPTLEKVTVIGWKTMVGKTIILFFPPLQLQIMEIILSGLPGLTEKERCVFRYTSENQV